MDGEASSVCPDSSSIKTSKQTSKQTDKQTNKLGIIPLSLSGLLPKPQNSMLIRAEFARIAT
jgi:hypothetical protein